MSKKSIGLQRSRLQDCSHPTTLYQPMSVECDLHSPRPWSPHLRWTINSGSHEVCNVARSVWGGSAELALLEIMRVCETIERQ